MNVDEAVRNHLKNIEGRYGKTLAELQTFVEASGLSKFGEKRDLLKRELGMGHGDANAVINHLVGNKEASDDPLSEIYVGPKAALLPLHEKVITLLRGFGEFEEAPKKGYMSLRRKKQFALLGPATKSQVEIGLILKEPIDSPRAVAQPAGSMCNYKIRVSDASEIDAELTAWLRAAFAAAG